MKSIINVLIISILCNSLFSQGIDNVLKEIEQNNTTLSALRKNADAEAIGNRTGIFLQDPEFVFSYLWGNPEAIGIRKDISVTQSFDFPSAYSFRNRISGYMNQQLELDYQKSRMALMLKARHICNDLIYYNALMAEFSRRILNARQIAASYRLKFDAGETGILEYNKSQLNLLNLIRDAESAETERKKLLSELKVLNGGKAIGLADSTYSYQPVPADFDHWYAGVEQQNPVLKWLKKETEISQTREKLYAALALPKFEAGYMSEDVVGESFRGITFGFSIPIIENRHTVRYARARTSALESMEADSRLQFYNNLKAIHSKASDLQQNLESYRQNLKLYSNDDLLKKAFELGELSISEYILELSFYYESYTRLLELERELNNTLGELDQYR